MAAAQILPMPIIPQLEIKLVNKVVFAKIGIIGKINNCSLYNDVITIIYVSKRII